MENRFKSSVETAPPKKNFWEGWWESDFTIDEKFAIRLLPYFVYVSLFILLYISNRYYTGRVVREVSNLRSEVEELRIEYTTLSTELMFSVKQTQVAKRASQIQLIEDDKPHYRIQAE